MKRQLLVLLLTPFFACKNNDASSKEGVIQSQEEKIKALEERLNNVENEGRYSTPPADTMRSNVSTPAISTPEKKRRYIKIGMTEDEVLDIQGTPSSIHDLTHSKIYVYGISDVTFRNGRLAEYSNMGGNLKLDMGSSNE